MRFFTALLSVVFGLLLLYVVAQLGALYADEEWWQLLLPALMVSSLVVFRVLDRLYRRLHPAMYKSHWGTQELGPGFNLLQALVSALRSAVLGIAIPSVFLGLSFFVVAPAVWLVGGEEGEPVEPLLFIAVLIFMVAILGTLLQWFYQRGALGLMLEKSGFGSSGRRSRKKSGAKSVKVNFRILDQKKPSQSKSGAEKQRSAKTVQRLITLRALLAPVAAFASIYLIAPRLEVEIDRALLVAVAMLFFLAWLGTRWRLVDRSPLRQLRLGVGWFLHAALVAASWPVMFFLELPGNGGRTAQQWQVVPLLGRWVGNLLRSPRLLWIPAILLFTLYPFLEEQDWAPNFFWLLAIGLLTFELIYFIFNRLIKTRQRGDNRLVFLRVFGDQRRGRFLFQHLAPRWAGMGSIICIAAPDVSVHQMEPDIGFDLLLGRLRQRFLTHDEAQVIGRHVRSDTPGVVREDHCFDDSWMPAVQTLLTQNAIVLMDLRGFTPQRKGCIYELGMLRDSIPIESVVFLTDPSTDFDFLTETLEQLWKTTSSDSPNLSTGSTQGKKNARITIFKMTEANGKSAEQLTQLLIEACVSNDGYHLKNGKAYLEELINDLQLLAADAEAQIKAVGNRQPGKKVLDAGWSSDHDLGYASYLLNWKVVTEAQYEAIYEVGNAVQEARIDEVKQTATGLKEDPAWEDLRLTARACLKALKKRRLAPKANSRK